MFVFYVFLILEKISCSWIILNCERNIISLERPVNNTNLRSLRLSGIQSAPTSNLIIYWANFKKKREKEKSPQGD